MSADTVREAGIVFNRFGLGPRPGDLAKAMTDPRALLKAELRPDRALIAPDGDLARDLGSTAINIQATFAAQMDRKATRSDTAARQAGSSVSPVMGQAMRTPALPGTPASGGGGAAERPASDAAKTVRPELVIYRAEALAKFRQASDADIGFLERLVAFWSNHFCVSVAKGPIDRVTAGSFEREAIRPYVLGRFADMLIAVEHHPAMLFFLDNAQSVGPDSRVGQNRKRGLNENLGREILELHTLGADAGYSQSDVTSLAKIITGWTFAGRQGQIGEPGTFVFNASMHEPGDAMVAGRAYLAGGFGQGEAALNDIARHPATARHVATKLVRHFVADDPPPAAVDRIAAVFRNSDGHLHAVSAALVDLPEAWSAAPTKMRNPFDFLVAAARLLGTRTEDPKPMIEGLRTLGMPLWEPPGPNGYPDTAAAWASPEGMKLRLDLAARIAHASGAGAEPMALVNAAFGSAASEETHAAIAQAESREQAIALLLMAPEFQRR